MDNFGSYLRRSTRRIQEKPKESEKKSTSSRKSTLSGKMKSRDFYRPFHGHEIQDLTHIENHLRTIGKSIIFLAGDSSLDNKFWFNYSRKPHVNGYEEVMEGSVKPDVAYHFNAEAARQGLPFTTLNCAVEESSVGSRACGRMLDQDKFILEHIREEDVLVLSVGGNDIALKPTPFTILNMLALTYLCTSGPCIDQCACGTALPIDDCFCGGVCGCLSSLLAWPLGMGYFIHLFKTRIEDFIKRLIGKRKPRMVVVCMIYYPCEIPQGGWADGTLGALGYNSNPARLQALIRAMYRLATQQINIPGTTVVAFPLFECLNSKNPEDYEQRVEPSVLGGLKMAQGILNVITSEFERSVR